MLLCNTGFQNTMVRVEEVKDNYVSSFNLFRLCKVEKLRQTTPNLLSRIPITKFLSLF